MILSQDYKYKSSHFICLEPLSHFLAKEPYRTRDYQSECSTNFIILS